MHTQREAKGRGRERYGPGAPFDSAILFNFVSFSPKLLFILSWVALAKRILTVILLVFIKLNIQFLEGKKHPYINRVDV